MSEATIRTQIAVFLDNVPGMLARLCDLLVAAEINILALTVSDTVDHSVVRFVPDKPAEAIHRLGEAGMLVVERDVVAVEAANQPGALHQIANRLADAGINIEYLYGTGLPGAERGLIVFRTSDVEKARELLTS
jgi:hypothetical protein